MQSQDDKELDPMLAAYLDGELGIQESRDLLRRLEAGDVRLLERLEALRAVRAEVRGWVAGLALEMQSIDLWPGIQAKLLAERQAEARAASAAASQGAWARFFQKNSSKRGRDGSLHDGGEVFVLGFRRGFFGGFALASCASLAAVFLLSRENSNFAGAPLVTSSQQQVASISSAKKPEPEMLALTSVPEPQVFQSPQQEPQGTLVSAGRDLGGYELANNLFSDSASLSPGADLQQFARAAVELPFQGAPTLSDPFSMNTFASNTVSSNNPAGDLLFAGRDLFPGVIPHAEQALGSEGTVPGQDSLPVFARADSPKAHPMSSPPDVTFVSNGSTSRRIH